MHRAHARYAAETDNESTLVARYGALVDRVARKLAARTAGAVAAEDLWSAGAMGLLEAARRFDAGRPIRFETFAEHRIRGAMLDEMRRMDHLPRRLRARIEAVDRARDKLSQSLQREPTSDEIASAAGLDLEDLGAIVALSGRQETLLDRFESPDPLADEQLDREQVKQRLMGAVAELPERLQLVLSLHYVEDLTYREIARMLDVSEPRVCQLHAEAMKRLRAMLSGE